MKIDPRILKPFDKEKNAMEIKWVYEKYRLKNGNIINFSYDEWAYYVRIFDNSFDEILFEAINTPYDDLDVEIEKWLENEEDPVLIYKRM